MIIMWVMTNDIYNLFRLSFQLIRSEAEYMSNLSDDSLDCMLVRCEKLGMEMDKITHNLLIHTRWSADTNRTLELLNRLGCQLAAPGAFNLYTGLMNSDPKLQKEFLSSYKKVGNLIIECVDGILEELETKQPTTHAFQSMAVH